MHRIDRVFYKQNDSEFITAEERSEGSLKNALGFEGRTHETIIIDGNHFANAILNSSINFF